MKFLHAKYSVYKLATMTLGKVIDLLASVEEKLLRQTINLVTQDSELMKKELSKLPRISSWKLDPPPAPTYEVGKVKSIDKKNLN